MLTQARKRVSLIFTFVIALGGVAQGLQYIYGAASSPLMANLLKRADLAWTITLLASLVPLWLIQARSSKAKAGLLVGGLFGVSAASLTLGITTRATTAHPWAALGMSSVAFAAWVATYIRLLSVSGAFGPEGPLPGFTLSVYKSYFPKPSQLPIVLDLRATALTDIEVVTPSTLRSWFETNPFCIRVVDRGSSPVGYWNALLLKRDAFCAFRKGELGEEDGGRFTVDWAEAKGKAVYLYIAAVACVSRRACDSAAVIMDLVSFFLALSEHSHVRGIAAWAASDQGEGLLDRFAFHCASHRLHGRPIFFVSRLEDIDRLAQLCRSMKLKMQPFVPNVTEASIRDFNTGLAPHRR